VYSRSLAIGLLPLACTIGLAGGCGRYANLTPPELTRLQQSEDGLGELRVHPSKKVWVTFPENSKADSIDVTKKRVTIRNDRILKDKEIKRAVTGEIISIGGLSEMPLLWVSFDLDCNDPSCAYGFVLTEYNRYSLVILPKIEHHDEPIAYRRTRARRNRLGLAKQRSLAEINYVLAVSRRKGRRVLTVDLQFSKKTRKRTLRTKDTYKGR